MCGCQALRERCCWCGGTAVLRWSVRAVARPASQAVAVGAGIDCADQSRQRRWPRRFRADLGRPVFSGIAAETWRDVAHGRSAGGRREAGGGALSGRIWRELQKGAGRPAGGGQSWGAAGGRAAEPGKKLAESAKLLSASPNWGRFIAMSAYRGGMSEAGFTGMLDPAAVPMIFAAWAAPAGRSKLLAGRGAVWAQSPELLLGESPGGPGRAGFSLISRSGVREAASRTGRKNSAGVGIWGVGAHFRRIWPSCCGGPARRRRVGAAAGRVGGIGRAAFKKLQ